MSKAMVSRSGYPDAVGGESFGNRLQVRSAERDEGTLGVLNWYSRPIGVCGMDGEVNIAEGVTVVQRCAIVQFLFKWQAKVCFIEFAESFRVWADEQDGGYVIDQLPRGPLACRRLFTGCGAFLSHTIFLRITSIIRD